jgi:hypothetical protein
MSMQSDSRNQDIFEMAFAGIPRVAELIAAVMSLIRLRVVEETVQRVSTAQTGWTIGHSPTTNGRPSDADPVPHTAAINMESAAA